MWAQCRDSQSGPPWGEERARWKLPTVRGPGHGPLADSGKVDDLWHQANSGLNPGSATNYLGYLGQVIEPFEP